MNKKVFVVVVVLLAGVLLTLVTFGEDFGDNKCFDEWTWCNEGTPDENAYWWEAGWCEAAIEAGFIGGSTSNCTSTPDDDYVAPVVEEKDAKTKTKTKTPEPEIQYCSYSGRDLYEHSYIEVKGVYEILESQMVSSTSLPRCPSDLWSRR